VQSGFVDTPSLIRVLEEDPDLGPGIGQDQWKLAMAAAVAPTFDFDPGPWRFVPKPDHAGFGALILTGMMIVRLDAGPRSHVELLGEGDVVSPWVSTGQDLAIPSALNASVIARLRVAFLDRRFALRTARWPELHAAVIHRVITRTRRLSLQAAINGVPRIEERLELTLWELANRFGRVTRDGIVVELPVTHEQLADIVAAQRPSVSTAIGRLQAHGRVVRAGRHRWLLPGEPPQTLLSLARESGLEP
jgi:CRP-like cAMP-binding protein